MTTQIKSKLVKVDWLKDCETGHSNGYVGVPVGHPWYKVDYDAIACDIHGGLTFAQHDEPTGKPPEQDNTDESYWWVGFDVCHFGDNPKNWNLQRCRLELDSLIEQARKATK